MPERISDQRRPGRVEDAATEEPEPAQDRAQMIRQRVQAKRMRDRGGEPLPDRTRTQMESRMGGDFKQVRVHTGGEAAEAADAMSARAFTVDQQIHFNQGEFAPGTKEGDRLLAHELTHVSQGQPGQVHRKEQPGAAPDAGGGEQAADAQGDQVAESLHGNGEGAAEGQAAGAAEGQGAGEAAAKSPEQADKEEQVVQGVMAAEDVDRSVATKIKDELLVGAAETLGVAELLGLRYKVTTYQAPVSGELIRGSRVDAKGMAGLKAEGVHGIVSFCMENDDDAKPADALGLNHLRIPILDNSAPRPDQVAEFLGFVKDAKNQPVYCHCEAGKGRTGTMVACYRIAVDGWTAQAAITEGKSFGLELINQIKFIEKFGEMVANGEFAG